MSRSSRDDVSMTVGMPRSAGSDLISAKTSRPPLRGMLRSRRMRPGRGAYMWMPSRRRKAKASTPSRAACSRLATCVPSKASRMICTSLALSSTRRISSTGPSLAGPVLCPPVDPDMFWPAPDICTRRIHGDGMKVRPEPVTQEGAQGRPDGPAGSEVPNAVAAYRQGPETAGGPPTAQGLAWELERDLEAQRVSQEALDSRARQQAAIVRLGLEALAGRDLGGTLELL